jgi:hypothetical protein
MVPYSVRKLFTGLATAALIVCRHIKIVVISASNSIAITNGIAVISILYA